MFSKNFGRACVVILVAALIMPVAAMPEPEPIPLSYPITISVRDANLEEVLQTLARIKRVELIVESGVTLDDTVTVQLDHVPWAQALHKVSRINGLQARLADNALIVLSADAPQSSGLVCKGCEQFVGR